MTNLINIKSYLTAISTNRSKSAEIISHLMNENTTILDYGCGTGRNMDYLIKQGACSLCGTDIPEQLEAQKEKHDTLRDKGCFIAPINYFAPSNFNLVLCSYVLNVIEHDLFKVNVIKDIYRVLTIGGKAVIEVRTRKDVENIKTKQAYNNGYLVKKGNNTTYQEAISKSKMIELCWLAGFKKIVSHVCNSSKHYIIVEK